MNDIQRLPQNESLDRGLLICMVGLPCSGKSSVTNELRDALQMTAFCEPEESGWAECVAKRDLSGRFNAHMWFRSIRTCQLYQADMLVRQGQTVLVDSYLDKLLHFCLGRHGMNWLLSPEDPYFDVARHMAHIDLEVLPLTDYIIFFDLEHQTWHKLLKTRSRKIENGLFTDDVFYMQDHLREGVEFLKNTYGVKVITIRNQCSSPKETAERLKRFFHNDASISLDRRVCLFPNIGEEIGEKDFETTF
jgi:deoxyadenosine/deoxycytidine kinase